MTKANQCPRRLELPPEATDANLASARTIADIPVPTPSSPARAGATIELTGDALENVDTDFELEASAAPPPSIESLATWDDSEHMNRLLNGDDDQPVEDAPVPASLDNLTAADEGPPVNQPFIDTEMFAPTRHASASTAVAGANCSLASHCLASLGSALVPWPSCGSRAQTAILLASRAICRVRYCQPIFRSRRRRPWRSRSRRNDADTEQARFDAPEAAAKQQTMLDEIEVMKTGEPGPFEPTDAAPLADADASQVVGAPTFTADELAVALQSAKEAQPRLVEGDLRDGRAVQSAKGASYSLLSDLANKRRS